MTPALSPFAHFALPIRQQSPLRRAITAACRAPERECITALLPEAEFAPESRAVIRALAGRLVSALRTKHRRGGVEALMREYSLSSEEGIALMCLAEALLRIPDAATRDALIRDKVGDGDWKAHLGGGRPIFVNATTWGLIVTGRLSDDIDDSGLSAALRRLVARAGEPVVRKGMDLAMRMMGEQFVTGETIEEALNNAREQEARGFTYSFDMLGEAAATAADAARYFAEYESAIHAIGQAAAGRGIHRSPGISIKLSALHPRYARSQADRVMAELLPRVAKLAALAKSYGIGLNIDAEEADRLELSLDLLESLALDPALAGWDGLGFVVQAYGKRCPMVIDWLVDLARRARRRIMVRLVKGAYWDAEIKRAQVDGLADFPVYTRKLHTDVAYIACARKLLAAPAEIYPQFATHNAQTVATIHTLAGPAYHPGMFEFQCLHGMGEPLYDEVVGAAKLARPCRIYAPVGTHDTLLAYLVRRLLENGANSSFVHRLADPAIPLAELIADPAEAARAMAVAGEKHEGIALPAELFPDRRNSAGIDLADEAALADLGDALRESGAVDWRAGPAEREAHAVRNPANPQDVVGMAAFALKQDARDAARIAAGSRWAEVPASERAAILERAADLMQQRMALLMGLAIREAGKSAANAVAEVREAIDFLRYYAQQARTALGPPQLPLGPVVCISPWNFPLAIFTGQIAAALAAGNPVLAKPAEETPLIAAEGVRLLHAAGVPADALQFLPGEGGIGAALVATPETAAVMFTGSTEVARLIQRQLAERLSPEGRPIPLIAETGGLNAMIVDSSALAEQVVRDAVASAFDSAGQRCSALRLLCLQEDVADRTLAMLKGALRELRVGDPALLATDVGPVITAEARDTIERHVAAMGARGFAVTRCAMQGEAEQGTFVPPTIIEITKVGDLEREVFGPVLHVLRYRREDRDALVDRINATGYGLTFGLHTRLDSTVRAVCERIEAGNIYVNRNTIGAVVGVQPFGGRGLSGTGPKAGGPLYMQRLVREPAALPAGAADPALAEFAAWLDRRGEADAARMARAYGEASGAGWTTELPGPVGERDTYRLHPRGCVLIRPRTRAGLFQQLAAVLASGNTALVDGIDLPVDLPAGVTIRLTKTGSPACALVEGDAVDTLAMLGEVARRPGPVLPVQSASAEQCAGANPAYRLHWLLEEVSISTDTTAAGGNASLMMI
ncbi:MAG: bifunctional proline dehydrogenase/L-glutamate gamma-semialdehyde dehydrogenase PutA [Candidatus Andeanibacterium colombiense]|uniref:Bifunctional protein PutA n=1 Tax=Candidatus Andeanibacterium colombiense TaxID=3121345 RepID=A0AAJ5X944_9SPHN|nr:MAG: bifunctional proline dehydrogenase/L-glutamate gamma-semialdehyde dehydrogenase PutA [Sphingomonadaceae bacterium]